MRARRARVAVALGVAALLVGGVFSFAATASAPPKLPRIAPDRLIASVLQAVSGDPSVSGHVLVHVDLGVPQIADGALAGAQPGLAAILTDHRLHVWRSPEGLRLTELLSVGERSLLVDRTRGQAWAWDSESFTAYRLAVPPEAGSPAPGGQADLLFVGGDPIEAVRLVLAAAASSTTVRLGENDRVAGRDAYVLVVEPRTTETLIGRIEVAIDARTSLPLSVRVVPRCGPAPAAVSFTDVDFGPVDPTVYAFSPPAGAAVKAIPGDLASTAATAGEYLPTDARTFGEGWTTVVALRVPAEAVREAGSGTGSLLGLLPLSASVLSIRAVDRDDHAWIVYGAVPQARLEAVEPKLP